MGMNDEAQRDHYGSGICSEDMIALYDHDARDPRVGHASCFPACRPLDVVVASRRWSDLWGQPIDDPDWIAFLETRKGN
jgi:hypothetical protein